MRNQTEYMDVVSVMQMLPHRYPFLLVDRVRSFESGEYLEAIKNVTMNEPFFQGHFPGLPVMPGVLQLEALAQAGGLFVVMTEGISTNGKVFMFTGIDKVKFRKPVVPGDQLILRCTDIKKKLNLWKMHGEARVDGEIVCQADLTATIVDKES